MSSNPIGLQFPGNFIAGTKSSVPVFYSASCCSPTIDVVTTDAKTNTRVYHVDVNSGKVQVQMPILYKRLSTTDKL